MMILVYGRDQAIADKISELRKTGRASGRNPDYWRGEVEKCTAIVVDELDQPDIAAAYRKAGVEVKVFGGKAQVAPKVAPKSEPVKADPVKVDSDKPSTPDALFGLA